MHLQRSSQMATLTFQKILSNLSNNANVKKLVDNFSQMSTELKKKETEIKKLFDQKKDEKIAVALKKYKELIKTLNSSERKLEKEVSSAISQIKKSADNVEKNIVHYRKKAVAQAGKIEKTLFAAKKKATKKTTKKTTAKKVTRKAAPRKTSKKATSKKSV